MGQVLVANPSRNTGMNWEDTNIDQHVSNQLEKLDTYLYSYELSNLSTVTMLSNNDFMNGTYRITKSGVYKLSESIVFNPNHTNDHKPTQAQIDSGEYPVAPNGPYHMGFFAAISIETDHVILDLNGFRIDQHVSHQIQQRFYSSIELGSSPFVPKQGPSNFGKTVSFPSYVLVKNGVLGRSSHHGIHGNNTTNMVIQDVEITDFEQAGWALNGCSYVWMKRIHVHKNNQAPVVATYSQARFLLPFLDSILNTTGGPELELQLSGVSKKGITIRTELTDAMNHVHEVLVSGTGDISSMESARIFENTATGLDGNVYGGVFHASGVSVHDFLHDRQQISEQSNHTIRLDDVRIEDLSSTPREVIGLQPHEVTGLQYGIGVQKGPVGDTFDIVSVTGVDGLYVPNVLSNAQLFLAKHGVGASQRGRTTISQSVIEWSASTDPLSSVTGMDWYKPICGGDSMAHVMKGNIGLFLSGATKIVCNKLFVEDMSNMGSKGVSQDGSGSNIECYNHSGVLEDDHDAYQGTNTRGLAIVSSKQCYFNNICVKKIKSSNGYAIPIDYIGENEMIHIHSSL
jgi:hypothetical protein